MREKASQTRDHLGCTCISWSRGLTWRKRRALCAPWVGTSRAQLRGHGCLCGTPSEVNCSLPLDVEDFLLLLLLLLVCLCVSCCLSASSPPVCWSGDRGRVSRCTRKGVTYGDVTARAGRSQARAYARKGSWAAAGGSRAR